ncbi:L,D-transpeptidase family protein [Streptomyces sp. NPDC051320]|uniref:L,D-transpeptidase family protein n=1 Tax=Streptomyces sp. NPDC051320 TaxID=3154644 RepID=UPI00343AC723
MRRSLLIGSVLLALTGPVTAHAAAHPYEAPPLPETLADAGGGSQLITAEAADSGATTGTVSWWSLRAGSWVKSGSAPARFGARGLVEGTLREQGTDTTPTGLYDLPYAFGVKAAPAGIRYPYRQVTGASWWCEDSAARDYNRWVEPRPADCRATEAEHLVAYPAQYARALVIGFNYARPVRGRGAGIFLHVNGEGATAGCVSVPAAAMDRILAWADPGRSPHIAIGTRWGPTALTRY